MVDSVQARLKKLIKESDFKQTEIAWHVGVSPQAITKWLKSGSIDKNHLLKVCELLNANYGWIITGKGKRHVSVMYNQNQKSVSNNMEVREPALLDLSRDEVDLIEQYRRLTHEHQQYMRVCMRGLIEHDREQRTSTTRPNPGRSAGSGSNG